MGANIGEGVVIETAIKIGMGAYIGEGAHLLRDCMIGEGANIGAGAKIGADATIEWVHLLVKEQESALAPQ